MAIKNLKEKMIQESFLMITKEGIGNFSVRNLSKRLNVSHNALYRHFKSKNELFFSVAKLGFDQMSTKFKKVRQRHDIDEIEKFKECSFAYVEFALKNTNVYKLMFGSEMTRMDMPDELIQSIRDNYNQITILAEECIKNGEIKKGTPYSVSNTAWAMGHGICSLIIENQLRMADKLDSLPVLISKKDNEIILQNIREVTGFSFEILFKGIFDN